MQGSYWGYWLIVLGIFVIVVMMLIQSVTTTNTNDYYLLKEVTEAAMTDAIDYEYYQANGGELKINAEKFVENFLRRFSESVNINTTYEINFYDIYEVPPKVSVEVKTKSNTFTIGGNSSAFDVINRLDAILESPVDKTGNWLICN